jgi:ATP-dependent DNA helicase RecG
MQLTAKVPFDDRRALNVPIEQLSMALVRRHLQNLGSGLAADSDDREVLRRMRITVPVNGHEVPRNVALLMFTEDPERWFPGARIEVAQFAGDARGNLIEERTFRGPLAEQVRDCLSYLQGLSTAHFQKVPDHARTRGWVSYPLPALEESIVNAVYHRSYEGQPEPVKVYLYPDRMQIISYPGPVPGIEPQHLEPGGRVPPVPARNRRIGEFLKELRLAESRGTGIPRVFDSMARNGSPPPRYEFDAQRTYFSVTLPAHPEYVAITALRDVAQLEAVGDKDGALQRLQQACNAQPSSGTVAAKLIETYGRRGDLSAARTVYSAFVKRPDRHLPGRVTVAMANACIDANQLAEAKQILDTMPQLVAGEDAIEAAILERRAGRDDRAHGLFQKAGDAVLQDARALHEFARTKMKLSHPRRHQGGRGDGYARAARQLLLREAKEMLQRVIQLDAGPQRHAWAWYDLGRVCRRLGEPAENSQQAFDKARELAPQDDKLLDLLNRQADTGQ